MKGLLLKDWYVMVKYCRSYLLFVIIFIGVSVVNPNNMFFALYPCLICGTLPITLLGYDERSHWQQYCGALPVSKAQYVIAKYLIGLFVGIGVLLLTILTQVGRNLFSGVGNNGNLSSLILAAAVLFIMSSSFCLPVVFKLGVEKGRIAFYVMIGIVVTGGVIGSALFTESVPAQINPNLIVLAVLPVCILIYAASLYLSIKFYQGREL